MNPKFEALMRKKLEEKGKMRPVERDAKMHVLGDLHKMATDAMANKLKGVKKVSVMAPDEESLKEGLDTAKDILGDEHEHEDMSAHEGAIVPDMEEMEEETGEDLDHDNEEGEPEEHKEMMAERMHPNMEEGSSEMPPGEHDEESEDELDARIAELMDKKKKLEASKKA